MRPLMRLWIGILLSLSLGMGAIAHAGEGASQSAFSDCMGVDAHDRDDGPRDSDTDKWGLHGHGGCHGHHVADALGRGAATATPMIRALNFAAGEDFLPQLVPDANLRPPIA